MLALWAGHSGWILVNSKPQTARVLLQLCNVRLLWHRWMSDLTRVMFIEPIISTLLLHSIWGDLEQFRACRLAEHRVAYLFDNIAAFQKLQRGKKNRKKKKIEFSRLHRTLYSIQSMLSEISEFLSYFSQAKKGLLVCFHFELFWFFFSGGA